MKPRRWIRRWIGAIAILASVPGSAYCLRIEQRKGIRLRRMLFRRGRLR